MRKYGKFIYNLSNSGYIVGKIVSEMEIHNGDELCYNGNKLDVVSKNGDLLMVKRTGCIINVNKFVN